MKQGLFTSESVSGGHPDKVCDRISDGILDAVIAQDPNARVAVESAVKGHDVFIFGEVTGDVDFDPSAVARSVISDTGYEDPRWGLEIGRLNIRIAIEQQSIEIGAGVGSAEDPGARTAASKIDGNQSPEF